MSHVTRTDYKHALESAARFHQCRDIKQLPWTVIEEVAKWVPADRVSFEHIAPTVPELWGISIPVPLYTDAVWQTFLSHIHEHPAIVHYQATGDGDTHRVYDFVSENEWHRTSLYQELHRELECEDQMGCCLGPPTRETEAIVLYRKRVGFTERDREMLNLLYPHAALALANLRALDRATRRVSAHESVRAGLCQTVLDIDENGRFVSANRGAMKWLKKYFPQERRREARRLPEEVGDWMRSSASRKPLVRGNGNRNLVIRVFANEHENRASAGHILLFEEKTAPDNFEALTSLGLTPREIEILREVEAGKHNREIAAALFISPATVKKHLENIFEKLNVNNRTAAVVRLRAAYS